MHLGNQIGNGSNLALPDLLEQKHIYCEETLSERGADVVVSDGADSVSLCQTLQRKGG